MLYRIDYLLYHLPILCPDCEIFLDIFEQVKLKLECCKFQSPTLATPPLKTTAIPRRRRDRTKHSDLSRNVAVTRSIAISAVDHDTTSRRRGACPSTHRRAASALRIALRSRLREIISDTPSTRDSRIVRQRASAQYDIHFQRNKRRSLHMARMYIGASRRG